METDSAQLGMIQSVGAATRTYVFVDRGKVFWPTFTAAVAASGALLYVSFYSSAAVNSSATGNALFLSLLPLAAPLILFSYYASRVQHLFMQQLGDAIGFSYSDTAAIPSGTFFGLGHGQHISDCLSGSYKGFPMQIFTYRYTVGSGKNRKTYTDTVFALQSPATLPHLVMNLPAYFGTIGMERVELEGDFNRTFSIHVEKGKQLEAREVLQPDVMATLVASFSRYCIECSGSDLYLVRSGVIRKRQDFLDRIAAVDTLFARVLPEFAAMAAGAGENRA